MTGPEHYREAERLLTKVKAGDLTPLHRLTARQAASVMQLVITEAQVHALLALAAATAPVYTDQEVSQAVVELANERDENHTGSLAESVKVWHARCMDAERERDALRAAMSPGGQP